MHDPSTSAEERRRIRTEIIERNLRFAASLSRRYRRRGQDEENLAQVAALGLVKAVDGYDPALGKPFFGYLIPTVLGEIRRHFRDKGWTTHVGRRLQERHLQVASATAELTGRLGRSPRTDEVAAELGLSGDEVIEAWAAGNAYEAGSLNAPVTGTDEGVERQDMIAAEDRDLASLCDRLALHGLLARLPDRDRFIVTRYFFGSSTQDEIGRELGMSQMNVSRLLRGIVRELRAGLDDRDDARHADEGECPAVTLRVTRAGAACHGHRRSRRLRRAVSA